MAKYIVGEGVSFTNGGITYKPGEEIPSNIFSKEALKSALEKKMVVEAGKVPEGEKEPEGDGDKDKGGKR